MIQPPTTDQPPLTSAAARAAQVIGMIAVVSAIVALIVLFIAALARQLTGALGGFGMIVGFLPGALAPFALIFGIVGLNSKETLATVNGRRHAIIGVVCGGITVVFCCIALLALTVGSPGTITRT